MALPRFGFRATPVATTEDGVTNERRYRAEVERAFRDGDMALNQIESRLKDITPPGPPVVVPPFATEAQVIEGTSPDTIVSPETLQAKIDALPAPPQGVPTGAVMYFAGDNPPGWLNCDGAVVTSANAALRDYLLAAGSPYGVSGADPLLPDLRGEFVRGADLGRGVDPGRVFGSLQLDQLQRFFGNLNDIQTLGGAAQTVGVIRRNTPTSSAIWQGATAVNRNTRFDIDTALDPTVRSGAETRPRNVSLRACIKT